MVRSNGKLIPFLKEHLDMEQGFKNLKYEDDEKKVFFVVLPRYMKDKYEEYEDILKEWYRCNGKLHKYTNYSKGKSVFQAALKKSIYLMKEKKIGKRLRYRFATSSEIEENRRMLREKEHSKVPPSSPLSTSSGYISGSEDENMHMDDSSYDFLEDMLNHPENYFSDFTFDENFFPDIEAEIDNNGAQSMASNDIGLSFQPVTELITTPVCSDVTLKKYWLCTQKINHKSTLQLICEQRVISNEDAGIKEGSIIIPNGVFEKGVSYIMKKSFELHDLFHIFFVFNVD